MAATFSASATSDSSIRCRVTGISVVEYNRRFDFECDETGELKSVDRDAGESSNISVTFNNLDPETLYHFTVTVYNIDKSPETIVWEASAEAETDPPVPESIVYIWATKNGETKFWPATAYIVPSGSNTFIQATANIYSNGWNP